MVKAGKTSSKLSFWAGWICSGLIVLFMLLDSISKFLKPEPVLQGTVELGYAEHHIVLIGVLGLVPTIFYAVPRTSVLGAVLLTGYFGGAVATHVRLDNPLYSHILFPVYFTILAWVGLWLRDEGLRRFFPVRKFEA